MQATNCTFTAVNGIAVISSTNASATNRFSGTFVSSPNGTQPINATRWILNSSPTVSYIQHALDGINSNSFVRFYTADNNLGQANPTDVRSGASYASGNLTGRLTVPARGSVALSVNYGPSMPFTATRSGTTATATMAYSYPLVVGDQITVTGASNSEWNRAYTIDSVVSGTSVTFVVPATHSASAGASATMQTTGTAVLDPAAVAAAVWGAATRTITGGTVDTLTNAPTVPTAAAIATQVRTELGTELGRLDANISSRLAPSGTLAVVTTLTNAPSVPSAASIADEVRVELATELARIDAPISGAGNAPSAATVASAVRTELSTELARVDQAISSRLAGSAYTAPANSDISAIKSKTDNLPASPAAVSDIPTTAQISAAVEGSILNEADGQAVLNAIVGAIGNTNLSEVSLVAAIRSDLERTGGKIDSIPTTAAPTAAQNATAVWGAATKEITGGTVTNLTNAPASVTPTDIWSHSTRTLTSASGPTATEIRQEMDSNSTKLANLDASISSRLAGSAYSAPATPPTAVQIRQEIDANSTKLDAVKAKTDALNTERLANVATTAIVGNLIAQANS